MGSALSSNVPGFTQFRNFVCDIEITIKLLHNMKMTHWYLKNDLIELRDSLKNFTEQLYQPQVLRLYCKNIFSKDKHYEMMINKYQYDTSNPFAELVNFKLFDHTQVDFEFNYKTVISQPNNYAKLCNLCRNDDIRLFKVDHNFGRDFVKKLSRIILNREVELVKQMGISIQRLLGF